MTEVQSRAERKEQTRRALLDGTLEVAGDRGFANVSLREIARSAGIVPTAFYRHFTSMDELGLALVDDGMRALRVALRETRHLSAMANARLSLEILARHVDANRNLFGFLYRERFGGSTVVGHAIEAELGLIGRELTVDLARTPGMTEWRTDDLEMVSDLLVNSTMQAMGAFVDARKPGNRSESEIISRTEKQLRLIVLGIAAWRPKSD
ncbi:TetR family transcriptional regulator [Antrihabitans sp. YC3-6]|uniref:TetR family transcriptional regulator n=1 Tax=Antrihabitans stalagmiti TaxID=2799499 RepID=A0A934NVM5_9NOCA|nr:TetR family transcriptional regulator [Antrihabitans stalagmiti]MBJ8342418.1 TetR family transcriptional regulator [Antrihabitans stalagmiti]